jgi:hypothetical protein
MKSILETCVPRKDIVEGNFNPEVFTASLRQVVEHYRTKSGSLDNLYTNPDLFFTEGTFPTAGMKAVLREVFGRIAGDTQYPAIHRLETSFGGGKTHTLIACTHLAHRGTDLASVASEMIESALLPAPGSVSVVGIPGDTLPVHQVKGQHLTPSTLWGEIAFQVGGEALYKTVQAEAESIAAPGEGFFETVFGGKKALIMLDELAQYAARLEAARPKGAEQLAAFLMGLHGYARTRSGVAIVLTLASKADAFSGQTVQLQKLLSDVQGAEVSADEALSIAERAERDARSVVARDAVAHTPVQPSEISRVLARRLFSSIDGAAARETAGEYATLYRKNEGSLPEAANRDGVEELIAAHYPFHPTFIGFLNGKLATVENFQGTRGVLRVLSLAVRNLWKNKTAVPMVHTCHLDLHDARIADEIIARTGSSDLLAVLNTDVGGVDTGTIEGGRSNAQLADEANRHPEGYPMFEWTWKTVFLHSLVGQGYGLDSNVFGLTEADALFECSFPGLTPPQVLTALKEIEKRAFYLRDREGRYYASLDPSVNQALAKIRGTLKAKEIEDLLNATTGKLLKSDGKTFDVHTEIIDPGQIPDGKSIPQLGLIALDADEIEIEPFVTTKSGGAPRVQQNLVFLLVPETVAVKGAHDGELPPLSESRRRAERSRARIEDLAKQVLAMRKLKGSPQKWGITPAKLEESDLAIRSSERELALVTAVGGTYSSLWFPSASGNIVRKEIKTTGAEGGTDLMHTLREVLLAEGEIVLADHTTTAHLINFNKLFFQHAETISLAQLRRNFCEKRQWPVLEMPSALDRIAVAGATQGQWCLYRMGSDAETKPAEIYTRDGKDVPLGIDLSGEGWSLVHVPGAKKRGWLETAATIDKTKLYHALEEVVAGAASALTVAEAKEQVSAKVGVVDDQVFKDIVADTLQRKRFVSYVGKKDQTAKPAKLIGGGDAILHTPKDEDVLITKAAAAELGWIEPETKSFSLDGDEAAARLLPLLGKLGSLYGKGAKSPITLLQIGGLALPGGGTLRLDIDGATPETMRQLDELFEVLADKIAAGPDTYATLEINDPAPGCALVEKLKTPA